MSYFYVDSTIGERTTGGGTTKQTGTFDALGAANLYATRALAITDGASSGDVIVAAQRHTESSATAISGNGPTSGGVLVTVVAENSDCASYIVSTTPNETVTTTTNVYDKGRQLISGYYYKYGKNYRAEGGAQIKSVDCTYETSALSGEHILVVAGDGVLLHLDNATLIGAAGSLGLYIQGGAQVVFTGGSVNNLDNLVDGGFGQGGAHIQAHGLDISSITGTVFKGVGGYAAGDDLIDILLIRCPTAASFTWLNETLSSQNQRLVAIHCANTSAAAEYQFYTEAWGGYVDEQDDAGIHRDETTAFPSGTKTSLHIVTNANADIYAPFWFQRPSTYAKLSEVGSRKLRFYLASSVVLLDTDIHVVMQYPDGTNEELMNRVSTYGGDALSVAADGAALTTDSGSTWLDGVSALTGYNEYYIDVDTSGDVGADCVPDLVIHTSKPSTVIYLDPVPDVIA